MRRALAFVALGLFGCLGGGSVARVVDGETREGRSIDETAYAAYVRAGVLESAGDREHALEELDRALDADPVSPELLTRIGELRCGTNQPPSTKKPAEDDASAGLTAFSRALGLDASYSPAWLGRARCLERLARPGEALAAAERAAYFDPLRVECTTTVARLLFALGRKHEAWVWLDGLALLEPGSVDAERARLEAAEGQRSAARASRSRRALATLDRPAPGSNGAALEQALRNGDLSQARARALELHLSSSELAILASTTAPELAFQQALAVLRADPSEGSAWAAALVAADLLGDEQRFSEALVELDREPLPPSARALELLAELIARRGGPDAARAFRQALDARH